MQHYAPFSIEFECNVLFCAIFSPSCVERGLLCLSYYKCCRICCLMPLLFSGFSTMIFCVICCQRAIFFYFQFALYRMCYIYSILSLLYKECAISSIFSFFIQKVLFLFHFHFALYRMCYILLFQVCFVQNVLFFFHFQFFFIQNVLFLFHFHFALYRMFSFPPFYCAVYRTYCFFVIFNVRCMDLSFIVVAIFYAGCGLNGIQFVRI